MKSSWHEKQIKLFREGNQVILLLKTSYFADENKLFWSAIQLVLVQPKFLGGIVVMRGASKRVSYHHYITI